MASSSESKKSRESSSLTEPRWPSTLAVSLTLIEELGLLVFILLLAAGGWLASSYGFDLGRFDLRPHQNTLLVIALGFGVVSALLRATLLMNLLGNRGRWNPPRAIVANAHRGSPILFELHDAVEGAFNIGRERYASDLQFGTLVFGNLRVRLSSAALTVSSSTSPPCFYLRVIPFDHIEDVEIALRFLRGVPHAVAVFHLKDEGELRNVVVRRFDDDARRWRNAWLLASGREEERLAGGTTNIPSDDSSDDERIS